MCVWERESEIKANVIAAKFDYTIHNAIQLYSRTLHIKYVAEEFVMGYVYVLIVLSTPHTTHTTFNFNKYYFPFLLQCRTLMLPSTV